jgi:hypothetical protein
MASYSPLPISAFLTSNDDLATLLLSLPALPSPLLFPEDSTLLRRRCNTTLAMLVGSDDADALRCRYPSKLCRNARVRKTSGALHRYCAYHRDKANANQKRWVDRQRETIGSPTSTVSSPLSDEALAAQSKYRWIVAATSTPPSDSSLVKNEETQRCEAASSPAGAGILSDDDWEGLLSLLMPPQSTHASPCDQRRRAASSPALPAFIA